MRDDAKRKRGIATPAVAVATAVLFVSMAVPVVWAAGTEPTAYMLQRACGAANGKFEQAWIYRATDVGWGEIASCVTGNIRLVCRDDLCRVARLDIGGRAIVATKHKASPNLGHAIPPERKAFDLVLRGATIQ